MSSKKLPFDVLIIGGGMAGISAASRLLTKKPSLRVGIVEARDRIGGRIHSIWRGKSRLDLGANWIHGVEGNPLMDILPEKRTRSFGMFPIIGPDGRPIENKRSEAVLATLFGVPHRMAAAAFALPSEAAEKISAADWLRNDKLWRKQVGQEPLLDKFAAMFENVEAAKLEDYSIAEYRIHPFEGEQVYLSDSYVPVINELAKSILAQSDDALILSSPVDVIDYSNVDTTSQVNVHLKSGEMLQAPRVIVTIPLGVLQSSSAPKFVPALSARKASAIAGLGFGTLDKIFLVFDRAWWDQPQIPEGLRGQDMYMGLDEDGNLANVFNPHKSNGMPVLFTFLSEDRAKQCEAGSDKEAGDRVMHVLRRWFGAKNVEEPVAVHVTRWHADEWTRGSYSHVIAGKSAGSMRNDLAEPTTSLGGRNVVYWAGEATSDDHFATVHGALMSGQREADRILAGL